MSLGKKWTTNTLFSILVTSDRPKSWIFQPLLHISFPWWSKDLVVVITNDHFKPQQILGPRGDYAAGGWPKKVVYSAWLILVTRATRATFPGWFWDQNETYRIHGTDRFTVPTFGLCYIYLDLLNYWMVNVGNPKPWNTLWGCNWTPKTYTSGRYLRGVNIISIPWIVWDFFTFPPLHLILKNICPRA